MGYVVQVRIASAVFEHMFELIDVTDEEAI